MKLTAEEFSSTGTKLHSTAAMAVIQECMFEFVQQLLRSPDLARLDYFHFPQDREGQWSPF